LRAALGSIGMSVGISAASASATGLRAALREARYARRLAQRRDGQTRVVANDELASYGLLLATVPEELRRSFQAKLLGPLLAYDREHQSDLVATLRVFLECAGSWSRSAGQLHIHTNTLRYRIGRIELLTGRDLGTTADRVDFFLALHIG
jgi:DNA-binding PucR family transcriptional regulator